jgi:hypothetical protein
MRKTLSALLLGSMIATATHAQSLVGDSIDAGMYFTVDTGYGVGRILGYGLDGPFTVQDGPADARQYSGNYVLDVDGGSFTISYLALGGWQEGVVLRLTDLDFSPATFLTGLTWTTNLPSYGWVLGPDFLEIQLGNTQFSPGAYYTGTFVTDAVAAVPEPETYALLAGGLLAIAAARRRANARRG